VLVIVAVAVLGSAAGSWWYLASRPEPYRPGEADEAITRALARGLPPEAPLPRFTDATETAGLAGFVQFAGERTSQLPEDMGSGAAWGDYDNDGDDDLFLVSSGGSLELADEDRAASSLYENVGGARFERVEEFPETRIIGMGAAWGDYDGDGRLDLVVTGYDSLRLFHNGPDGFVRDETFPELRGFWSGASWGDYDRDGDLDLYVCGYVRYVESNADRARALMQYGRSVPYTLNPASYKPERNLLFRNEGQGRFSDVAEELGVDNTEGRSLGALWHDLDDDGWLDLYVANDISDNVFYRNTGTGFEEIAHAAWVADYRGAMGLTAGDWNRDGDDDLFITHWVAQENALYDSQLADHGAPGDGHEWLRYTDVADQRGLGQIALRLVGWGTEFADFDADGWLDLVVANGSTFETDESPRRLLPQLPLLMWNRRGEYFHDIAPASELLSVPHVTRGLALSDVDDDGDLDLLLMHHSEGAQLLLNQMQTGNWIKLRVRNRMSTPGRRGFGDGAKLILTADGIRQRRTVGGPSYLSQSSRTVHFGLGSATTVEQLEVRWPDGTSSTYRDLQAGATFELFQGESEPRPALPVVSAAALDERQRIVEFWERQRAAMRAMKVQRDLPRAIALFRRALELDPGHEDSIYYLANCLATVGDTSQAIVLLDKLARINPQSHRAHRQAGVLRAMYGGSEADLDAAESSLQAALAINPEETGALLTLGEIALMRGDLNGADRQLTWACGSNPRAVGGFFLRGYLAWKRGDTDNAVALLAQAREALGEEWVPEGMTAEGDVQQRMHDDATALSCFWQRWDGSADPTGAFTALERHLETPGDQLRCAGR
jgi:Flp pilus assembly protein TadD